MRWSRWAVTSALCALVPLLASCGDDPDVARVDGDDADRPVLFEEGTELGSGLVVPARAASTTPPAPMPGMASDVLWSVDLVASDAVVAFNDVVRQAEEAGFELRLAFPSSLCVADGPIGEGGSVPWPWPDERGVPQSLNCSVSGVRDVEGAAEELRVQFNQTVGDDPTATGSITVAESNPAPGAPGPASDVVAGSQAEPLPESALAPAFPPEPPPLEPGDPLIERPPPVGDPPRVPRLVAGSRPVVPLAEPGRMRAVLDVTSDPDEVMAGYVEQLREWSAGFSDEPQIVESNLLGRRVVDASVSVDGVSLHAVMVVGSGDEPTRIVYEQTGN